MEEKWVTGAPPDKMSSQQQTIRQNFSTSTDSLLSIAFLCLKKLVLAVSREGHRVGWHNVQTSQIANQQVGNMSSLGVLYPVVPNKTFSLF